MGCYRFQIGEARIDYYPSEQRLGFDIETMFAADHAEPQDSPYAMCNWRDIGGAGHIASFCRRHGLETLFFGSGWVGGRYGQCPHGFHRDEPLWNGEWAVLVEGDLLLVREARERHRRALPEAPSGWWDEGEEGCPDDYDEDLSVLEWMEWWMEWALKRCERPIIVIA